MNKNLLIFRLCFVDLFSTAPIEIKHSNQDQKKTKKDHAFISFFANLALIF